MSDDLFPEKMVILDEESLRLRAAEIRSLRHGLRAINSTLPIEDVLSGLVESAAKLLKVSNCSIGLLDDTKEELQTVAAFNIPQSWLRGTRFKLGSGIAGLAAEKGEPMLVGDVDEDPRFLRLGDGGTRSIISVPLMTKGTTIGTISATSPTANSFTPEHVSLLQAFADQAALAITNARLYQESMDRALEVQVLYDIAKAINSSHDLRETLGLIAEGVARLMQTGNCSILLFDRTTGRATVEAVHDESGVFDHGVGAIIPLGDSGLTAVFESKKAVVVNGLDRHSSGNQEVDSDSGILNGSRLLVPLTSERSIIGAISVDLTEDAYSLSEREVQMLGGLADQVSVAVQKAKLYGEALQKNEEMQFILEGIGDAVVFSDLRLRPILLNPAAKQILGEGFEEPDHSEQFKALYTLMTQARSSENGPAVGEVGLRLRDDSKTRTYQAVSSLITGRDDLPKGIVTVLRDITALKEVEAMKSNFLSVVSHELRTPLNAIKGFVDIILLGKTGPLTALQEDFLKTVKKQSSHLHKQIDDLLELSRLEASDVKLNITSVSIHSIAFQIQEGLSILADERQIELQNNVDPALPRVEGDGVRLQQVITNLVANAIKFTPKGGTVRIEARDLGRKIEVSVIDTGIGIPIEEQGKLFQSFYQVGNSVKGERAKGFGLGLAICKHIIERHHSYIEVNSEPEKGSRFSFALGKKMERRDDMSLRFVLDGG